MEDKKSLKMADLQRRISTRRKIKVERVVRNVAVGIRKYIPKVPANNNPRNYSRWLWG